MSNHLEVAVIDLNLSLHRKGWSRRRIASELDCNRETVARYIKQAAAAPKPANAPPGFDSPVITPDASVTPPDVASELGSRTRGRPSDCEPWRDIIQSKCNQGLSAQRIYQDLASQHGFKGSYYTVRRFVRRIEPTRELPFRRIECEPGDEAQVDFGTGAMVVTPDGKRRRTHVLRIVLSHSRKAYSEAVYRQTTDDFLRSIESAFRHFGGAPRRLVLDNLKAAVKKADWFDPELNPKVRSFGEHYGFIFWPTRPRTPRHKGKVEKGVDYVQDNGLKARRFTSLEEQNAFLLDWELTVADTRIHGTTRRQVGKHFAEVERAGASTAAVVSIPIVPRGSSHLCTVTATSRSNEPITPYRRNTWRVSSGRGGTAAWCASTTTGWSKSPCIPGRNRAASARHRNSLTRRRSAGSKKAPVGSCTG
jgi:transposase